MATSSASKYFEQAQAEVPQADAHPALDESLIGGLHNQVVS